MALIEFKILGHDIELLANGCLLSEDSFYEHFVNKTLNSTEPKSTSREVKYSFEHIKFYSNRICLMDNCILLNHVFLRTVPTIVTAHTFCASPDTRISSRQCLPIQGYFCAV